MNRLTLITATLLAMALFTLACSNSEVKLQPVPTAGIPTGAMRHAAFRFDKPPSLDWQILDSATIIVASHLSTTAAVETVPTDPPLYRPMHVLKFRVSEYLKGTGPNEITIEVPDTTPPLPGGRAKEYATQEEALSVATALMTSHNSKWDNRSAVLFLSGPYSSVATQPESDSGASGASSTSTVFTLTNNHRTAQDSFKYTVDSLSRGWLPANSAAASGATGSSGSEYITNIDPSTTVGLSNLKSRISVLETELNAGDDSFGYVACVRSKYIRPWYYEPNEELTRDRGSLISGVASGSEFGREISRHAIDDSSDTLFFTGEQASFFEIQVVDNDTIDGYGMHYSFRANRPLPAGEYHLRLFAETQNDKACNYRLSWNDPGFSTWFVDVESPTGALHEAFFDPVTIGTAVGADATNGVLKPTSFTVGETATQITGLKWANNQAVLTLNPHVSLAHYALDFIELDGTVSLTLLGKDATLDAETGTHTWSVETQPWHDGDKLMLRIREDATPTTTPTP